MELLKFIKKLLVFIIPVLLFIFILEINFFNHRNIYSLKKEILENNLSKYKVLVLGSSHVLYGVNPALFNESGFNLAQPSQSFYYDYEILLKYIKSMPSLRVVIIPVSYFSFEYDFLNSPEYWRSNFYKIYFGIPDKNEKIDFRKIQGGFLFLRETALLSLKEIIKVNSELGISDSGAYRCKDVLPKNIRKNGLKRIEAQNGIMDRTMVGENEKLLGEIIELCIAANIEPVIITTPALNVYEENLDKRIYLEMQNTIAHFCKKYNIKYYNYMSDGRFSVEDFCDADHLNFKGADKFSRVLNQEILHNER